jgi:hypothetical protein
MPLSALFSCAISILLTTSNSPVKNIRMKKICGHKDAKGL